MENPKNPKAFPIVGDSKTQNYLQEGMTLRDYFAAKAMLAFTSNAENFSTIKSDESCAIASYALADAMLKERIKNQ